MKQFAILVLLILLAAALALIFAGSAKSATRLGDFEATLRDFVVFRDGSTTVTGKLVAESGQWWLDQNGTLYVKTVRWQPSTEATVEELKSNSAVNEMKLWRPSSGEISLSYRHADEEVQLSLVNYEDRVPGMVYDIAIVSATSDDLKIGQFVQR